MLGSILAGHADLAGGLNEILLVGAGIAFAAGLASIALIRARDFVEPAEAEPRGDARARGGPGLSRRVDQRLSRPRRISAQPMNVPPLTRIRGPLRVTQAPKRPTAAAVDSGRTT